LVTTTYESNPQLDGGAVDFWAFSLLCDKDLRNKIRRTETIEMPKIRVIVEHGYDRILKGHGGGAISPIFIHQCLVKGLPGTSLLTSSALWLDSVAQAEEYFGMSFKTFKSRLGETLDTTKSELVMRGARITVAAHQVFGSFEAAREYIQTRNFALGGARPADLMKTSEGERIVLNELQAQAGGGPL